MRAKVELKPDDQEDQRMMETERQEKIETSRNLGNDMVWGNVCF